MNMFMYMYSMYLGTGIASFRERTSAQKCNVFAEIQCHFVNCNTVTTAMYCTFDVFLEYKLCNLTSCEHLVNKCLYGNS